MARVLGGDAAAGAEALHRAVALADGAPELKDDLQLLPWLALGPIFLRKANVGRSALAQALADRAGSRRARRAPVRAVPARPRPGDLRPLGGRRGHLPGSDQPRARERSAHRSRPSASPVSPGCRPGGGGRRRPERWPPRRSSCAVELGARLDEVWATAALGELELGLGDAARAAEHFEDQRRLLRELGITDVDLSPAAELVDAYVRLGRVERRRAGRGPVHDRRRGQGAAVVAGPRAALPRARGRRRRPCRAVRAGAPPPRAYAGRVRDRPHAARVRRASAAGPQSRPGPRSAPGGGRGVRAPRRPAVGRAGASRAGRDRARRCGGAIRARSTS